MERNRLRCTRHIHVAGTPLVIPTVPLQDPPQAFYVVKTYSKRPQNIKIAQHFLKYPTVEFLLFVVGVDTNQFDNLLKALPKKSQMREFFADFKLACNLSLVPPTELATWSNYSVIWQIFKLKSGQTGMRARGSRDIRALYQKTSQLPYFLRNLTMQIMLEFKLGNMHFIQTYPRFLRNKASTRNEYSGKFGRMADWFTLTEAAFAQAIFDEPYRISDIQLCENIYLNCQTAYWLGSTGSQYITALKHFGTIYGDTRFHSDKWKDIQADLRKTFGTRKSDQRMRKAIHKSAIKKVYQILRSRGSFRKAEILRFMALTGQRNIDYHKFTPVDIFIDFSNRIIRLTWKWGKTRSAALPFQVTMHPFGKLGTFFDLLTCVQQLLELKPRRAIYLLRVKCAHSTFLRRAFAELPLNEQPECLKKITPYYFKNVMAQCCLESRVAAEVASHYLKHTLSDQEWANLCSNSHINLSKVSQNYVIAENLVPHIQDCFAPWWNETK